LSGDDWGRDPQVRALRGIFAAMEEGQKALLAEMGLSPLDPRLAAWRRRALGAFERAWGESARQGMNLSPSDIAALYARALAAEGAGEDLPPLPAERFGPPALDRLLPRP
jgi:hypothetical protein